MNKRIKIIEEFTTSKYINDEKNEDGYFYNDDFVLVVDGVTSKIDEKYENKTGGVIAKDIIIETIKNSNFDDSKETIFKNIVNNLHKEIVKINIKSIAATCIIYSKFYNEIWSLGDCKCMIGNKLYIKENELEMVSKKAREMIIYALLNQGYTEKQLIENDLSREKILPILLAQNSFANKDGKYGYAVLNGDIEKIDYLLKSIQTYNVDNNNIIFSTDGYFEIFDTLKKTEDTLIKLIKDDPLCYKVHLATKGMYKGNKSFDDRTYVRFCIE